MKKRSWGERFDSLKKGAIHAPKNKIDNVKQHYKEAKDFRAKKKEIEQKKYEASLRYELKQSKGIKAKAKTLGKRAGRNLKDKGSEMWKRITAITIAIVNKVLWCIRHVKLLLVIFLLVFLFGGLGIWLISLSQGWGETPHMYCDSTSSLAVQRSAAYKQYCSRQSTRFVFENLNGHYVVQDGSGPCLSCAIVNMWIRYYATYGINFYDVLWDATGKYSVEGQMASSRLSAKDRTVRGIINDHSGAQSQSEFYAYRRYQHGYINFGNFSNNVQVMANWGYFRDAVIDKASWDLDEGTYYYSDNDDLEGWTWDTHLTNWGSGTFWGCNLYSNLKELSVDGLACNIITVKGDTGIKTQDGTLVRMSGDVIREMLETGVDPAGRKIVREAGILYYYTVNNAANNRGYHAILITGFDPSMGTDPQLGDLGWIVVDSALGPCGGYEGPLINPNFAIKNKGAIAILNGKVANIEPNATLRNNYGFAFVLYCVEPEGVEKAYLTGYGE